MSLVPTRYNFTIYQGATFYKRVYYKLEGVLQNLTGYSAELIIKEEAGKPALITLSDSTKGITLGGVAGTIDLEITKAETSAITWESAIYELLITDTSPRTDVLLNGGFKVVKF